MAHLRGAVQAARRKRVVAIDFGTYGSGFCHATLSDVSLHSPMVFEAWPEAPSGYPKARSAILYQGRYEWQTKP